MRLALATYTPVTAWLDEPVLELGDWAELVRAELEAQQER